MIQIEEKRTEVEDKIIKAANKVFLKNGIQTTTMAQIAEEAGISRTLLNYYYRSKKHLVVQVINGIENNIIPAFANIIDDEKLSVIEKTELFIDEYLTLISEHPMIPPFILSELNQDPEWFFQFIRKPNLNYEKFTGQIGSEIKSGLINNFRIEDLFVNVIGLCIFPIVGKPVLNELFFNNNKADYNSFIESRHEHVKGIIRSWLVR